MNSGSCIATNLAQSAAITDYTPISKWAWAGHFWKKADSKGSFKFKHTILNFEKSLQQRITGNRDFVILEVFNAINTPEDYLDGKRPVVVNSNFNIHTFRDLMGTN